MESQPKPFSHDPHDRVVTVYDGWTLHACDSVGSTNLVAAPLPAWHAVTARSQTAGRGRFQRSWISDAGGLWLSAVVPIGSGREAHCLPLLIGLAVADTFRNLGVRDLRMRWPNDLLAHNRKLAGLLIDQFQPGLAVAGIGINVYNHPEAADPALQGQTARLADLLAHCPTLEELTGLILDSLRAELQLAQAGWDQFLPRINALWGKPREVELDLDGTLKRGTFLGVDHEGRLLLSPLPGGLTTAFRSNEVRHLQEI